MHFNKEVKQRIDENSRDTSFRDAASDFMTASIKAKYSYNFSWMGQPIIQYPQDMIAMQEIIWKVKPDMIVETGIARGGSLIFYASLLELLSISGYGDGVVVGIDIEIREHNKKAIISHPMSKRIEIINGSSTDSEVIAKVREIADEKKKILICLDSNHTDEHVTAELEAYAPLTSIHSYCVVFDTIIDDLPETFFQDRPWGPENSPKSAVQKFLVKHPEFKIDKKIQNKLLVSVAPDGYLKRIVQPNDLKPE